ncbi:MAG: metal ABC transporter permease [Planctomycetota bacterium]
MDLFAALPLLWPSLLASLLAAVACGATGPLVVSRRMVFLAGAIAHVAIGGVGAALFLRHHLGWNWLDPVYGALVAATLGALVLATIRHVARDHLDTLIGASWAVGMAIGLVLVKLTPGYHSELMSYLFGYLPATGWSDVYLLAALVAVIAIVLLLCFKRLVAAGLDPQQLRLQGLSVWATDAVLLVLVALSVVALTRVVGLILVIALLTLPTATVGRFTRHLSTTMLCATGLNLFLVTVPRALVFGSPIAPEPAIVLSAAAVYLAAFPLQAGWRRLRRRTRAAPGPGAQ